MWHGLRQKEEMKAPERIGKEKEERRKETKETG